MLHRAVLAALTLMLLTACDAGGSRNTLREEAAFLPSQEVLAALPSFPAQDEPVHPLRATASVDALVSGRDFDSASPAVSVSGNGALLPAVDGQLEWAIYRFSGVPDELISAVSCSISGLDNGEEAYVAVADYAAGRWTFLVPQSEAELSQPLSPERGRWQSPSSNSYIAVLAHDAMTFVVEEVSLRFEERYTVLGEVLNGEGEPVEGVFVSSMFGAVSDFSDASGQFSLVGLPEGSWPVAASMNGWTFYDQPVFATIDGADSSISLVGNPGGSRYVNKEAVPGNDLPAGAFHDFLAGPLEDSISVLEDPRDFYRFEITQAGSYYFYFHDPLGTALFPSLTMRTPQRGTGIMATSASVIAGSFAVGFSLFEVPQEVIVEVSCGVGGADYELSLHEGAVHAVGGKVTSSFEQLGNFAVEMELTGLAHETEYFARSSGNELSYVDLHRRPGNTLVVPEAFGASFTPLQQEFTLGQQRLNVDFTAQLDSISDDFEPNDFFAEAHEFETVPVELEEFVSLGGSDTSDWYSFTPPAGNALSIHVLPEAETRQTAGMDVMLYDSQQQMLEQAPFGDGYFFEPDFLTSGEPYYIELRRMVGGPLKTAYLLEIDYFEPTELRMQLTVGESEPVTGALFKVHTEDFEESYSLFSGADGLTAPLYFEPGSIVHVECRRFGLAVDGETRRIELSGSSFIAGFNAPDWGIDSNEPNEDEPVTRLVSPPILIEGSASAISDRREKFRIPAPPNGAIRVEANIDAPNGVLDFEANSPENGEIAEEDISDGDSLLIPVRDEEYIDLDILAERGEFTYSLQLSPAEGYIISGTAKALNGDGLGFANVMVNPGGQVTTVRSTGAYDFDILPPGDYTVSLLAVGGDPSYIVQEVSLVDSDVTVDFSGVDELSTDDYEPNNSSFQAHEIDLGLPYLATVGDIFVADNFDWYEIKGLTAGDMIRIRVNAEAQSRMFGKLFLASPQAELGDLYYSFPGLIQRDFVVPADGDYLISLEGYGAYMLEVTEVLP